MKRFLPILSSQHEYFNFDCLQSKSLAMKFSHLEIVKENWKSRFTSLLSRSLAIKFSDLESFAKISKS